MIHHYLPLYLPCHFTFWIVSLKHILLILMKFNLHIYFLLLFMLLVSYIRIHCQIWASRYTPTFSSKKFIVLDPQFRFLTQVNFGKCYKVRVQFHSLHVAGLSRCCSSVYGKLLFPHLMVCVPLSKSADHRQMTFPFLFH